MGHVRDLQKATACAASYLRSVRLSIANHLGLQLSRFFEAGRLPVVIEAETLRRTRSGRKLWSSLSIRSATRCRGDRIPEEVPHKHPGRRRPRRDGPQVARAKNPGYKLGSRQSVRNWPYCWVDASWCPAWDTDVRWNRQVYGLAFTLKRGGVSGWLRCGQAQSAEYGLGVASCGASVMAGLWRCSR